ncbi:ABC transporter substrate-binding protein [Ideonella sp. BN130291]|uniref:ABC transporter substrate-binding protein n=1 Tax=Ideonella sp. BN130291 TaxID=3112940 RepID=UPI002E267C63|nr:ABC transporter substrate-binding protein [Ideonella sp. BN130291]
MICRLLAAALLGAVLSLASAVATPAAAQAATVKTLRYAFPAAETGFDPVGVTDIYSRTVLAHVFDAPYRYDYLARPYKVVPNTAAGMPEASADFKTWTVRLQPGIYFADDPAFKGVRRELVAQDYVYTWKRYFDPANKSSSYASFAEEGVLGLEALREEALSTRKPFDYDRPVEGIRALDRYTVQFKLAHPRPRFLYTIADSSLYGAVAREVVEFYGDKLVEHPVGTGPFRLQSWRRSSQIVLERNPGYREVRYDGQPAADDREGQALLRRFKGRRLPMVDRVDISIIEESQPRWLAFLNGELDLVAVPLDFATTAIPGGKLAPNLARKGLAMHRLLAADTVYLYFNMEDPVVGGYTPEKVALRRAIGLAYDVQREIRDVRRGQAIVAQSPVVPNTFGYDPQFKTENSDFDLARAKSLLDLYGYVDKDGDGWRDLPDGQPLVLRYPTQPSQIERQFAELWKKCMDALAVRMVFETAQWPENYKKAQAGQLMMWQLGGTASAPDVQDSMQTLYGPAAGGQNLARLKLPAYDQLYEQILELPDGPQRMALIREASRLVIAFAPKKYNVHRIITDLTQPRLQGFRRPPFGNVFWQYVDIQPSRQPS